MGESVEEAIDRAVAFLRGAQLPHGEFRTLIASDMQMSSAEFDSSPFVTTFVVYALNHLPSKQSAEMVERALDFLEREMEFGGVWRYYSSRQYKHCRIPPDLDDTACATYALRSSGRAAPDNRWIFSYCRDDSGRFQTWIVSKWRQAWTLRFWLARLVGSVQAELARWAAPRPATATDPRLLTTSRDPIPPDDVDPVVCANAILLLGECAETARAMQYIIDLVRAGPPARFSLYYRDVLALYYAVARACRHSAPALGAIGGKMTDEIISRQQPDGSFGAPLSTALAASVLQTFASDSDALTKALRNILDSQRADGSWEAHPFYCGESEFWGSEELTTALCLEALARRRDPSSGKISERAAGAQELKFDLRSAEFHRNPYPLYEDLRRNRPVHYDPAADFWMVSRYADVCAILKNQADYSSVIAGFEPTLLGGDPPVHTRARRAARPILNATHVAEWEGRIRELVRSEISRTLSHRRADMIKDLFRPLQVKIISWVFGFDEASFSDIERWSGAFVDSGRTNLDDRTYKYCAEQMLACKHFMRSHLSLRQHDRGDWPVRLLFDTDNAEVSTDELVDIGLILLVGGYETTPKLLGNALILLGQEPALVDKLRKDKTLISPFLEEVLRYDSPVQRAFRVAKRPMEVAGVTIPQGGRIVLLLGAANRDETQFSNADRFQLDRDPNNHITFGLGPHFCLGARLARMESRILLEELLEQSPSITLASRVEDIEYVPSLAVRGPRRLDLLFPTSAHR